MHTEAFQVHLNEMQFNITFDPKESMKWLAWRARTSIEGYGSTYALAMSNLETRQNHALMIAAKAVITGGQHSDDGFHVNLAVKRHGDSPQQALTELVDYLSEVFTKMNNTKQEAVAVSE